MSLAEDLESVLIETAENKNYGELKSQLSKVSNDDLTPALKKCLSEGAQLVFEDADCSSLEVLECALGLCSLGVAPVKLRDFMGNAARKAFSSYPDPAGLVKSLGCNENDVTPQKIAGNWGLLSILLAEYADVAITGVKPSSKNLYCYTNKSGFGKIEEVDAFGDTVSVTYRARQNLSLANFIENSSLVVPESLAWNLLEGKKYDYKAVLASELAKDLEKCLSPEIKFSQALITRIMMPKYIKSVKAFETWYNRKSLGTDTKAAAGERNWGNSRSLAELNEHLPESKITPDAEQTANLKKIFKFAANKPLQVQLYSEIMCILWDLSTDKGSLSEIVVETAPEAVVWQTRDQFEQVTDKMMAKHLNGWFHITLKAKGVAWLVENCLDLPYKFWPYIEKALEAVDGLDDLVEAVKKQIKTGSIGADSLMWLWSKYSGDHDFLYPIMGNPALIIRTLGRDVRGNYIKASKDLRKLLVEKEAFQKFIMDNGSEAGVSALVSAVRSMTSLDQGEKQSVLIKIVRIYPDKKYLVEERKVKIAKSSEQRVTSVVSYKEKQAELKDIINVQMPQNRDAISTAAAHGDFRENFEFHAAKDRKKLLESRRGELEEMLDEVKPTDFTEFEVKDRAIIGSVVELETKDGSVVYTILGLWDSDPDKKYISYETPLGEVLLGRAVGDEIELPGGGTGKIKAVSSLPADLVKKLSK
ncbi:MAG: GreA/GreB family elongation factor [Lentisphaeraceae bacterium]|nr:GreA/GreB family elongation factor [Lentisphaeraceae bacterium]